MSTTTRTRAPVTVLPHPRDTAIEWLREKTADGKAHLHPDETGDLLVVVGPNERRWGNIAVNLCGVVIDRATLPGGGECIRLVAEADVRLELGLDEIPNPHSMAADAVLATLPPAPRVGLALVEAAQRVTTSEPVSMQAMRDAKAAYDVRYPHGVEPQLALRADTKEAS
jgi:hypothetical protein